MTERNNHAEKAREILAAVQKFMDKPSNGYEDAQHVQNVALSTIAGAQVHATIAIAEQLRVANIIAIANNVSLDPDVEVTSAERAAWLALASEEAPHEIRPEIKAVLGL